MDPNAEIDEDILAVYLEELEESLARLQGETDIERVRRDVDGIRGSGKLVGCPEIAEIAQASLRELEGATTVDDRVVACILALSMRLEEQRGILAAEVERLSRESALRPPDRPWWKFW